MNKYRWREKGCIYALFKGIDISAYEGENTMFSKSRKLKSKTFYALSNFWKKAKKCEKFECLQKNSFREFYIRLRIIA